MLLESEIVLTCIFFVEFLLELALSFSFVHPFSLAGSLCGSFP